MGRKPAAPARTEAMIVTVVQFPAPPAGERITVDDARARFGTNAAQYLDVPGLLWKAYLVGDDGAVGGTYWWADRASAEAAFNDGWTAGVTEKYGAPPMISWYEAPVVVDARFDVVRVDPPPRRVAATDGG